jgi:hypothetical protein
MLHQNTNLRQNNIYIYIQIWKKHGLFIYGVTEY